MGGEVKEVKDLASREDKFEKIIKLSKRRGFFWYSYEIYGGVGGFITLGPLGVLLKNNIVEKWRKVFILPHQDFIIEIESPIIAPEKVFLASGHLEHFTDYIVECLSCRRKFRADHLIEEKTGEAGLEKLSELQLTELIRKYDVKCPECGGELDEVRKFNLLFKTNIGPYSENVGFARPETAQGMFVNFNRIYQIMRRKLPLGIAQIGKVMRNEISPRQGPIRLREFTIMELELFYDPKKPSCDLVQQVKDETINVLTEEDVAKGVEIPRSVTIEEALKKKYILNEWNAYFMALAKIFLQELGVREEKQMFVAKLPEERAHYAAQTYDQVVYVERWGWIEVSGHAYRTDYDLRRHTEYSGKDLRAQRRLPKPVYLEKVEVRPLAKEILREYGKEVLKELMKLIARGEENLVKQLKEKGYVAVGLNEEHIKVEKRFFEIVEKREEVEYEKFFPHVAEPSFGAERLFYVTLEYAYSEKKGRIVLRLPRELAPIKVGVLPIVSAPELISKATNIYLKLKDLGVTVVMDSEGSIGKRYAQLDEIGVPFAITIDRQTLSDDTVTVRDRDTWKQVRIPIKNLSLLIKKALEEPKKSLFELAEELKVSPR